MVPQWSLHPHMHMLRIRPPEVAHRGERQSTGSISRVLTRHWAARLVRSCSSRISTLRATSTGGRRCLFHNLRIRRTTGLCHRRPTMLPVDRFFRHILFRPTYSSPRSTVSLVHSVPPKLPTNTTRGLVNRRWTAHNTTNLYNTTASPNHQQRSHTIW